MVNSGQSVQQVQTSSSQSTVMWTKLGWLQISSGIEPVRSLSPTCTSSRASLLRTGTSPVKKLFSKTRSFNRVNWTSSVGMVPSSLFCGNPRVPKLVKRPSSVGKLPVNRLDPILRNPKQQEEKRKAQPKQTKRFETNIT